MMLLTVFLVLSLHPQSPAAETLYPKADCVNATDVPEIAIQEMQLLLLILILVSSLRPSTISNTGNKHKKFPQLGELKENHHKQ